MGSLSLSGVIIFDSNPRHAYTYPTKCRLSHLEVIHSPIHVDADSFILEYLATLKNRSHIHLVTSDRALANASSKLQVKTLSSSEFFAKLSTLSIKRKRLKEEIKPLFESKKELERLQKIFENPST